MHLNTFMLHINNGQCLWHACVAPEPVHVTFGTEYIQLNICLKKICIVFIHACYSHRHIDIPLRRTNWTSVVIAHEFYVWFSDLQSEKR